MSATLAAPQVRLSSRVLDHLLKRLDETPVCDEPFSHFHLEGVFPDDVYRELLSRLPDDEAYTAISDKPRMQLSEGVCSRQLLELEDDRLQALPAETGRFWSQISDALRSPALQAAVFTKLARDLSYRFDMPEKEVANITAWPKPALMRDFGGYEIAPHPDGRKKIVTMQLYLPRDESQLDLGTWLYRRRRIPSARGLVHWEGRFQCAKRLSFAPNSGYAFVVNNTLRKKSWHGRPRLPRDSRPRNSLFNIYYATPEAGY